LPLKSARGSANAAAAASATTSDIAFMEPV
jgi:hypothetical protein